ncbi:MAG: ubiquinol-cytochrome C chaperone [Alphaproteobacteria bacterium]|nr:ubiquinol-cytochrome C chaperone [Alphaproteobacteria bacterium]MBV8549399.1 ubiquinol-cytochrome C chaperone [Alphaproteobacteria bacterium]
MRRLAPPVAEAEMDALYRLCIVAARRDSFYKAGGVPDTLEGRFDLLLLHVWLAMRHLPEDAAPRGQRQQLFDIMFADMDRNLREMGIGDMGIPKRMKALLNGFYGRTQVYEKALGEADGDAALATALARNVYFVPEATAQAHALAAYVRQADQILRAQASALAQGRAAFPDAVFPDLA